MTLLSHRHYRSYAWQGGPHPDSPYAPSHSTIRRKQSAALVPTTTCLTWLSPHANSSGLKDTKPPTSAPPSQLSVGESLSSLQCVMPGRETPATLGLLLVTAELALGPLGQIVVPAKLLHIDLTQFCWYLHDSLPLQSQRRSSEEEAQTLEKTRNNPRQLRPLTEATQIRCKSLHVSILYWCCLQVVPRHCVVPGSLKLFLLLQ